MCRWIAYSGPTVPLSHYVTEPSHSLISQSLNALEATTSTNGDGFGLGWYGEHQEPGLYHEVRPAWSDSNLRHLCRHLRSHLFFAHVRAATATAVVRVNCHPFAYGRWLFMHNGMIADWPILRRAIEALIPDAIYPSREGTTDSEAIFLAIVGANIEENPVRATETVMRKLKHIMKENGDGHRLRFTAALSNGRDIYAFRYAVNDSANTLYYRSNRSGAVIASEPLDAERATWAAVDENCMLIARRGYPAGVVRFSP
ncbi:MAG TPA: class II glutamine amidotransferase [Rhodomicrobium sp.]|nr:class II glutamine amidotransferase [Rhodomicrobium sp.]